MAVMKAKINGTREQWPVIETLGATKVYKVATIMVAKNGSSNKSSPHVKVGNGLSPKRTRRWSGYVTVHRNR